MRVLVVAVLALALLASAEPLGQDIKKAFDKTKDAIKSKLAPSRVSTRSTRSSSSSGSSSGLQGNPALMAKEIGAVFGDADGSAYFKGNKILPHTVAEVPPRKKPARKSSSSQRSVSSHTASSHRFREPLPFLGKGRPDPKRKSVSSHVSSHRSSASNPRYRRPLFNFNTVPTGVTGVGLRKHAFGTKHHHLLVKFCNNHRKVTTVILVDKFVGPNGRPSKKDKSLKRGHKQSNVDIKGLLHKNLFIFNDKFEQIFPAKKGSSSSSKSGSSKSGSSGSVKTGTAPPRPSTPVPPPAPPMKK